MLTWNDTADADIKMLTLPSDYVVHEIYEFVIAQVASFDLTVFIRSIDGGALLIPFLPLGKMSSKFLPIDRFKKMHHRKKVDVWRFQRKSSGFVDA
jgi:hypothetical protein